MSARTKGTGRRALRWSIIGVWAGIAVLGGAGCSSSGEAGDDDAGGSVEQYCAVIKRQGTPAEAEQAAPPEIKSDLKWVHAHRESTDLDDLVSDPRWNNVMTFTTEKCGITPGG